ncbi:DDE_3 domain-containing protein [Trichonephila clavipes]|nr:DDE_3 domain-containing protein [Trichonephila clavipes]
MYALSQDHGCVAHGPFNFGNHQTARIFKVNSAKSIPRIHGCREKSGDRGKLQRTIILYRGERRLRRIVRCERSQTLAQTTTQLSEGACRTVSKRTVQCSLHHTDFGHLHPFMLYCYQHGDGVFLQGNCTSHKSRMATGWLDERFSDFFFINWPPKSPDLNRIEHLWVVLEQGQKGHPTSQTNFTELWTVSDNIWQVIPVERFQKR